MSPYLNEERGYRTETVGERPWSLYHDVQRPILKALGLADYPVTSLDLHIHKDRVTLEMRADLSFGMRADLSLCETLVDAK